jgi:hypothetical protein
MQIKAADDVQPDIDALQALLHRPDLASETRACIEQEIRTMRAGAEGEHDAAYEIEFHCAKSRNQATIHGLRLENDGRTAQIDHLIINRLLDIWVCESKHFREGVEVNEPGEWTRLYQGRPQGMASPLDQNGRHIAVLAEVFAKGYVSLPSRLGISVKPRIRGLVLISNEARITRPAGSSGVQVKGLESVVKVEHAIATINADFDKRSPAALLKIVTPTELETFARQIAALHVPIQFDWARKFGVPAQTQAPGSSRERPPGRPACRDCGRHVSDAVIAFCESRPEQFGGVTYCVDCQVPFVTARA